MTPFDLVDTKGARKPIQLGPEVAQGFSGTVHQIKGEPKVLAKLYKNPADRKMYQPKIDAMLAAPPSLGDVRHQGAICVQLAWPTGMIFSGEEFRGFTMPEIDFQKSTELENILQKSARQRKKLPEFYGARVLLAANLAGLMAELHSLGHYMIDMKPMNMRFYPQVLYTAILDTDGFSINGHGKRFNAGQFSDEYIAPEAKNKKPQQLGLGQDLFALAVIVFRLLNNGIHPFQGIDSKPNPTTIQERSFERLYAYGIASHPRVKPSLPSIHGYFEDETRSLFDRAFLSEDGRPTAAEWSDHLHGLIRNHVLQKCAVLPSEHGHFSKGCGLCALESKLKSASNIKSQIPVSVAAPSWSTSKWSSSSVKMRSAAGTPRSFARPSYTAASSINRSGQSKGVFNSNIPRILVVGGAVVGALILLANVFQSPQTQTSRPAEARRASDIRVTTTRSAPANPNPPIAAPTLSRRLCVPFNGRMICE